MSLSPSYVWRKKNGVVKQNGIEKACKEDSCCWRKDGKGCLYDFSTYEDCDKHPKRSQYISRKGGRDEDYNLEGDCDFEIRIPEKGDTIFVINTITHS